MGSRRPPAALGLLSGSLDSRLALALMRRAGFRVECVHFETGFLQRGAVEQVRRLVREGDAHGPLQVHRLDLRRDYLGQVVAPRLDAAARLADCVRCRTLMLRRAARLADERGLDYLFTGEVLGQAARGQTRADLQRIAEDAGVAARLLRPLSARLLPDDDRWRRRQLPESALQALHGRSRRGQLALALSLGVDAGAASTGRCCWLADGAFCRRLRDAAAHGLALDDDAVRGRLSLGRHLRLNWRVKLVVSRDEEEGRQLARLTRGCWTARVADDRGALVVVEGDVQPDDWLKVAAVAARFRARRDPRPVAVRIARGEVSRLQQARAAADAELAAWRI